MERGLNRFIVGALVGVFILAGSAQAQQAGSYLPDQLTAVMLGQDGVVVPMDDVDPTEPKPLLGLLEGIQAKGSVNVAYTYNFNDSENGSNTGPENPGRIFDTFHNEVTVHNAILYLEKPVDNDNLIGFAFTPSVGKDSSSTQGTNISFSGDDLDILQLNIQIYTPDEIPVLGGTTFEVGKFLTNAGAEVIDAPYNDNFSRSWLFGLAIPFAHAGVRATKTLLTRQDEESMVDLSLGIANGWDNHNVGSAGGVVGISNGNFPTFLNTVFFTPGGALDPSLTVNYFVGETTQTSATRNLVDIVASLDIVEDLSVSANFDWVGDEAGDSATGGWGELYGFAGILRYDFAMTSEKKNWYVAGRGEYVDDTDGFAFGVQGTKVYELTGTIGFMPFNNLLLRTEVRYDKADAQGSGTTSKVFENGDSNNQTTLSFDVSLLF